MFSVETMLKKSLVRVITLGAAYLAAKATTYGVTIDVNPDTLVTVLTPILLAALESLRNVIKFRTGVAWL